MSPIRVSNDTAHRRRAKDARMEYQRNRGVRVEPPCSACLP